MTASLSAAKTPSEGVAVAALSEKEQQFLFLLFFFFCYFCNENLTSLTDLHICIISTCHQRTQVTRIALAPCCPAAAKPLGKHPHVLFLQRPNGGAVSLWLSE